MLLHCSYIFLNNVAVTGVCRKDLLPLKVHSEPGLAAALRQSSSLMTPCRGKGDSHWKHNLFLPFTCARCEMPFSLHSESFLRSEAIERMPFTPACPWKTLVGHLVACGWFLLSASVRLWGEENESGVVLTKPSMRWLLQMRLCSSLTSCLQSPVLGLLLLRQGRGLQLYICTSQDRTTAVACAQPPSP